MNSISQSKDGIVINVKVVPRASKNEIAGELAGALKVRLQAPPVEGKANKALVGFLSEVLDVSKSSIEILSGETGRKKKVLVRGISRESAQQRMSPDRKPGS
jgi:uncharacterized protein (TIGR00251 family)